MSKTLSVSSAAIMIMLACIELNAKKGSLIIESLEVLRDKTLAMDADVLLKKVKANPKKSIQDGHCALDMSV